MYRLYATEWVSVNIAAAEAALKATNALHTSCIRVVLCIAAVTTFSLVWFSLVNKLANPSGLKLKPKLKGIQTKAKVYDV